MLLGGGAAGWVDIAGVFLTAGEQRRCPTRCRNVTQAAIASNDIASKDIASNIAQAADAAEQTAVAVADNRQAAASLATISAEFRQLVSHYRY